MITKHAIRRRLGFAVAASAIALTAFAHSASADPAPGTCKTAFEVAAGPSPNAAQQIWVANVAGKFGTKWAHWVGAQNNAIVAMNGGAYYQAVGKPCFYQPVL
jgi:hypothetical protein